MPFEPAAQAPLLADRRLCPLAGNRQARGRQAAPATSLGPLGRLVPDQLAHAAWIARAFLEFLELVAFVVQALKSSRHRVRGQSDGMSDGLLPCLNRQPGAPAAASLWSPDSGS